MELPSRLALHARHGDGAGCGDDHRAAQACRAANGPAGRLAAGLIAAWLAIWPAAADTIRIATYHTELGRDGPGLLLRDTLRAEDDQIAAVVAIIAHINPDILLLQDIDYDLEGHALAALAEALNRAGAPYPHRLALRPNSGMPTGLDLDGNGRLGEARDAQGYGRFNGAGGMAVLSRHRIGAVQDHSAFLWRDLPGGHAEALLSAEVLAVQRLASVAAWAVPVETPGGTLTLLTMHATPPVFDGPEDRNGRRNEDELRFWQWQIESGAVTPPFALMGVLNADPERGDARRGVLTEMLTHPALQDPAPTGAMGTATAVFSATGPMRVDYILPAADIAVTDGGVFWPEAGAPEFAELGGSDGNGASRHRLVWLDIDL